MSSIFDTASALIKTGFTDNGWTVNPGKVDWIGVEEGSTKGGTFQLNGGFAVISKGDDMSLMFLTDLRSVGAAKPSTNSVMQTYI